MRVSTIFPPLLSLTTLTTALATPVPSEIGTIRVLHTTNEKSAPASNSVGCLDSSGRMIVPSRAGDCGTFTQSKAYPYNMSSAKGNCTFMDATEEENTDNRYGRGTYAFTCKATHEVDVQDNMGVIEMNGIPYLCFGRAVCFYDAKTVPVKGGPSASFWGFYWGSLQFGITPGHVELQLLWEKK